MNSKNKGGTFERKIARELSLWLSNGKRDDLLWRSSISGGRATRAAKKGKLLRRQCGDLSAVDPLGCELTDVMYVELKHVRNLGLSSFLLEKNGLLAKFWRIAVREADKYERKPMIIAKQNNVKEIVVVDRNTISGVPNDLLIINGGITIMRLDHMLKYGRINVRKLGK